MFKKHFFKIIIGVAISIILIYFTLRQIDFNKSWLLIKSVNYWLLIPALATYLFTYVLRAVRYYFILSPLKKTKILENFPYTVVGFFTNNIVPLRLGEFIRAKITGLYLKISGSSAFATIVIERLFDIMMFVLFFFLIFVFMPFPSIVEKSFYILFAIGVLCFIALYIIIIYGDNAIRVLSKIAIPDTIKSFIFNFFNKFASGLIILKRPIILFNVLILSAIVWLTEAMTLVVIAYACGIKLSILGAIFTIIIIGVGSIVPTMPGYFGAYELMGVLSLSSLGIDKDLAFTCIAISHLLALLGVFGLGFVCIVKTKLSLADLFKFTKDKDEEQSNVK
ncbi:MAG: flippase-like domain-containing protein [Endomicrobium sp.]|jgi:uncharacterized protein (TIRG00374 family)|nr:flippase-like domain-containing protein [Endomicrobium sp.]